MRTLFDPSALDALSRAGLSVLLDATLKATPVLVAVGLLCLVWRRASAATRHLLLCVALVQVALLPLLALALPAWQLPIPMPRELAFIQTAPRPLPPLMEEAIPSGATTARTLPGTLAPVPPPAAGPRAARPAPPAREPLAIPATPSRWLIGLLLVWAAGALLVTAPLLAGAWSLRHLARGSPPPAEPAWSDLLQRLTAELGLRRPVALRESAQVSVPMTWGLRRPLVLLPTHAHDWSPERRHLVLLHELAHVQRADCLTQLLAQFACALHWFNPLVWLAARQLRVERERACDDRVLQAGARASAYAEHLLEIARGARRTSLASLAAVAMARPSQLEGRLLAVLDAERSRRAVSRLAALAAVVAGSAAVLPLAALEAAARGGPSARSATMAGRGRSTGVVARQIWTGRGVNDEGAPSPDGRYLSFIEWDTGDLAVRDLNTGRNRRLTNKGPWTKSDDFVSTSIFSPDGRQIAYGWWQSRKTPGDSSSVEFCDLRLIRRDGSRARVLYSNEDIGWLVPADWSSDGKQILTIQVGKDKTSQMALVSVSDGSARVLKAFQRSRYGEMRLSPDGSMVAYDYPHQSAASGRDIFLLATDSRREIPLVQHPADDFVLGWARDGKSLLFASDRTGAWGAWLVRIDDGKPQGAPELVKSEMGAVSPLGFDRNGSLYYSLQAGISDVYTAPLDPATGQVLALPQPVEPRFLGSHSLPAWSPDGRYLAYYSTERNLRQEGTRIVTIRSLENGETRELSLRLNSIDQLDWSSDGRSLLALGEGSEGRRGTFRIDAQTGAITALSIPPVGDPSSWRRWAAWGHDGKTLFYPRRDPATKRPSLMARDLESGRETVLHRGPYSIWEAVLALSPNGRQLAFSAYLGQEEGIGYWSLRVMTTSGGEPRELLRLPEGILYGAGTEQITTVAWMPDGRHLLFGKGRGTITQPQAPEVWRIPVAGGAPQQAGLTMSGLLRLTVHPDGRRLAFTAGSRKREIWVMENLFPAVQTAQALAPQREPQ